MKPEPLTIESLVQLAWLAETKPEDAGQALLRLCKQQRETPPVADTVNRMMRFTFPETLPDDELLVYTKHGTIHIAPERVGGVELTMSWVGFRNLTHAFQKAIKGQQ